MREGRDAPRRGERSSRASLVEGLLLKLGRGRRTFVGELGSERY
jgi:hypothetical protein